MCTLVSYISPAVLAAFIVAVSRTSVCAFGLPLLRTFVGVFVLARTTERHLDPRVLLVVGYIWGGIHPFFGRESGTANRVLRISEGSPSNLLYSI